MPRCCGGASCACVIQEGAHIDIVGTGQPGDPFVVVGDVVLSVVDNMVFNLTLTGLGTALSPWGIEAAFAPTAKLNDLPDVTAPTPTNGQVLGWDSATSQWTNRAPTTAASGSVSHDTSLAGDGSAGLPLQVAEDANGYLTTGAGGLGLTDVGKNRLVRRFADATARAAASPAPTLNTLSVLDTSPGQIDYYTGSAWTQAGGAFLLGPVTGEEMYQMSGPYSGGRMTVVAVNLSTTTDSNGTFDAISAFDLAGRAGIMTAYAQPIAAAGLAAIAIPFTVMLSGENGALRGKAYRLDDGTPYALSPVTMTVVAHLY